MAESPNPVETADNSDPNTEGNISAPQLAARAVHETALNALMTTNNRFPTERRACFNEVAVLINQFGQLYLDAELTGSPSNFGNGSAGGKRRIARAANRPSGPRRSPMLSPQ